MIPVDQITEQELTHRFDALSSRLKDALTSDRNATIVDQVCDKNRISDEERRLMIHQLVGLVMLGFIHDYDLGSEINQALSLDNPKFSTSVADELNAKILSTLKDDLQKIYHPLISTSITTDIKAVVPKITPPAPAKEEKAKEVKPSILDASVQSLSGSPTLGTSILGDKKMPEKKSEQAPTPQRGWAGKESIGPVIKFDSAPQNIPPKPVPPVAPSMPKPQVPPSAPTSSMPSAPKPPAPPMPAKNNEPAPVILHQDATFQPLEKKNDFRLDRPGETGNVDLSIKRDAPHPAAVIEFSKPSEPPKPNPAPSSPQKMVHYTDFKPSTPPSTGTRNVSEITQNPPIQPVQMPQPQNPAPMPKPSMPPTPPTPSNQTPPAPQKDKVIFKNFLDTDQKEKP